MIGQTGANDVKKEGTEGRNEKSSSKENRKLLLNFPGFQILEF